jgi:hypothetical protein
MDDTHMTQIHAAEQNDGTWECSQRRVDGAHRTRSGRTFEAAFIACDRAPWLVPQSPKGAA